MEQKPKRKYNKTKQPKAPKLPPVLDKNGNKLCPIHKNRHLLRQPEQPGYTGMCAHPDCVSKIITTLVNGSPVFKRYVMMLRKLDAYEDFLMYLYEKLLIEAEQGKPTIINGMWFKFKLQQFSHFNLNKGEAVLSTVPLFLRGKYSFMSIDEHAQDVIDREYEAFTERRLIANPETKAIWNEVYRYVEDHFGKHWCLLIAGELTLLDISKVEQLPLNIVRRREKNLYRTLRDSFLNDENKDILMEMKGVDGNTPLKNIVVPSKYEGYVRGGNQKIYPQYWETLADKINMENGVTKRGERFDRAMRNKLAQIKNIEEQFPHTLAYREKNKDELSDDISGVPEPV